MHRQLLEDYLECLWADSGVEYKFVCSSSNKEDMDFFQGQTSPPADTISGVPAAIPRQVTAVPVAGPSSSGGGNYRVDVPSSSGATSAASPSPKRPR